MWVLAKNFFDHISLIRMENEFPIRMKTNTSQRLELIVSYLRKEGVIYNWSDFSNKTSIVRSFLSEMRSGKKDLSEKTALKIVSAFPQINPGWLLTGEGEMIRQLSSAAHVGDVQGGTVVGAHVSGSGHSISHNSHDGGFADLLSQQRELHEIIRTEQVQQAKSQEQIDRLLALLERWQRTETRE